MKEWIANGKHFRKLNLSRPEIQIGLFQDYTIRTGKATGDYIVKVDIDTDYFTEESWENAQKKTEEIVLKIAEQIVADLKE